jgi:hypothetical protein
MADVEKLLHEFIAEDRAGGTADPLAYLDRVEGTDRVELEVLIDGYLARAPRRAFDQEAFDLSPARALAGEVGRALGGASGTWPALLPRLRHRAQLRRADVVERLAAELEVSDDARAAKVARYYHEMEHGTLPAAGVSDRVLQALGRVVGVTAQRLRDAGRSAGGVAPGAAGKVAFARVASPDRQYVEAAAPSAPAAEEPRDEIDALFTSDEPR